MPKHTTDFRGFDDWVEVFQAGRQTDSRGRTETFTRSDLDEIVANHSEADAAPIVIGHPKTNDPAYGWTGALKRLGDKLYAKFRDVMPEFARGVEAGHWRKRSVRLCRTDKGLQLLHVGFLGAAPPAVSGMAPMNYQAPAGAELMDFEMDAQTPGALSRVLRRLRDWIISRDGLETADQVLPDYEIEDFDARADAIRESNRREREGGGESEPDNPAFSRQRTEAVMPYTDDDLKKAREEAAAEAKRQAEADFSQRLGEERRKRLTSEYQAEIDAHIDAGRLKPAQAEGMAEFMLQLAEGEEAQFEFSVGEGKQAQTRKQDPVAWFRDFVKSLPQQVSTAESDAGQPLRGEVSQFRAPAGYAVDEQRAELDRKARDYMRQHQGVEYLDAVRIVEQQQG